jgi:hypothetical protein
MHLFEVFIIILLRLVAQASVRVTEAAGVAKGSVSLVNICKGWPSMIFRGILPV